MDKFKYGTAGFRMKAENLIGHVHFVGQLACLRSKCVGGQAIGVMITASHNEWTDNGVKIVDYTGEMLEKKWESYAQDLLNERITIKELVEIEKIHDSSNCMVYFGRDTRPTSVILLKEIMEAVKKIPNSKYVDFGLTTTPQLHYMVYYDNINHKQSTNLETYYDNLFVKPLKILRNHQGQNSNNIMKINVDCAFGVGSVALKDLSKFLSSEENEGKVEFLLTNSDPNQFENLNSYCGAEYVQKERKYPIMTEKVTTEGGEPILLASIDGDADRIVFSVPPPPPIKNVERIPGNSEEQIVLLDGDRIASLFLLFFHKALSSFLCEKTMTDGTLRESLRVGVVQTAYANGSSTDWMRKVCGPENVIIVPTGVKYLHEEAKKSFDVGIYFEANGHGTVLFSQKFHKLIQSSSPSSAEEEKENLVILKSLVASINPTVGDAISDLFLTHWILRITGMSIEDWLNLYKELPSKQVKIVGKLEKAKLKPCRDETRLVEPVKLQKELDEIVKSFKNGRCFIRPSGTEDAIRVYMEAETKADLSTFEKKVRTLIDKHVN